MNESNVIHNTLTVLMEVGKNLSSCDLALSVEPNIYFLLDSFTRRGWEEDWQSEISKLHKDDIKKFTMGLVIGMGAYWTDKFSPAALALGKELSHRFKIGQKCLDGDTLSKFMFAVRAYDEKVYLHLANLPGLMHDVKMLEMIDNERVESLKEILRARNRVKLSYFRGNPDELTEQEESREKEYVKDYGDISWLFNV